MKKRRTLIISLLLIAAMALGIGYAGFSVNMVVNGDAKMNAIESQVVFESATLTSATKLSDGQTVANELITLNKGGENTNALSIKLAGFKNVGDKAVVTVTIYNPHDFDVTVDLVTFTSDDKKNGTDTDAKEYLQVTHNYPQSKSIGAQETFDFTFTVECQATSADAVTENFELKLLAKAGTQSGN